MRADLADAVLRNARLVNAVIEHTSLYRADLSEADLRDARLTHVDLTGAILAGSRWSRALLLSCVADKHVRDGRDLAESAMSDRDSADTVLIPSGGPGRVIFSPDGTLLAATWDAAIVLVDARRHLPLRVLAGHRDSVRSIAFSPNGKLLASASTDSTVRVWQVDTGRQSAELCGHQSSVQAVCFSPDGTLLASGGGDGRILLWRVHGGRQKPN